MIDNSACELTHKLLIYGRCPRCSTIIQRGRQAAIEVVRESQRQWDMQELLQTLRYADAKTASTALTLLDQVVPDLFDALPYYERALLHSDLEVNNLAAIFLAGDGGNLLPPQVEQLEARVADNPEAFAERIALLGSYFLMPDHFRPARQLRRDHILWIIANRPSCAILEQPFAYLYPTQSEDRDAYGQGRQLWLDHLQESPDNLALLWNASSWCFLSDATLSEKLLRRGQAIDQEPKWSQSLGHLYRICAEVEGKIDPRKMKQAVAELERALANLNDELGRADVLLQLAEACLMLREFDKGASCAKQVVRMYEASNKVFAYEYVHRSYLLLGRIMLERGDSGKAKEFLLKAAEVVTAAHDGRLSGPYMTLAKKLLRHGEKEVVLEYLRRCAAIWTMPNHELEQWSRIIEEGGSPDFGPVYLVH